MSEHAKPADAALRVTAIESLMIEKGLVDPKALDSIVEIYETKIGPRNGARVIAKAWVDPDYKARLLADGTAAIAEFGYTGVQGEDMVVVENTPTVHNLVVCTLCSCYPWPTLAHGVFCFNDTNAHGLGHKPQHVFTVSFTARELWGPQASAHDTLRIDMFDDYLEPAPFPS